MTSEHNRRLDQARRNHDRLRAYYRRRADILYRMLTGQPVPVNQVPESKWIKVK